MTPSVYVYLANLPPGINEFITEGPDGSYTVYLEANNSQEEWEKSYKHALKHIENYDFQKTDVQTVEFEAHASV